MREQSKILKDGLLFTGIYILLLLIAIFIPFLFVFFIIVFPIPFVIFTSRYNWKFSTGMLITTLCITLFISSYDLFLITLTVGVGGIALGEAIYKENRAYETWAKGTLGFIVGLLFMFLFYHVVLNINWMDEIDALMNESFQTINSLMTEFGFGEEIKEQMIMVEEQISLFKYYLPASIAIISIFLAFTAQWISYKTLNWLDKRRLFFPPFKHLNFPKAIIWFYLLALIVSLFNQDVESLSYFVVVNALALTSLFIIIQGFSFIFFYAAHKKVHIVFPILIVIVSVLIIPPFLIIIRIIGIIDIGFSLKNRMSKG